MIRNTHTIDATILATQSVSGEIDLEGFAVVAIEMPAAWDAADLTFQAASLRGGDFKEVQDADGVAVTVKAAANVVVAVTGVEGEALAPLRFLKLRSGTPGVPVAQAADRTLRLICKSGAF